MAGENIQVEKIAKEISKTIDSFFRVAKRKRTIEFIYRVSKGNVKDCYVYSIVYRNNRNNYYGKSLSIYFYYYKNTLAN